MSRSGMSQSQTEQLGGSKYPAIIPCYIESCVTKYNDEKGSESIEMVLTPIDQPDKKIRIDKFWTESASGAPMILNNKKKLYNLGYLLNPEKPDGEALVIEEKLVEEYSFETKKKEMVLRENYAELLNKPVNVLITCKQEFTKHKVNGYNNRPLPKKSENEEAFNLAIQSPETIEMPNYSNLDDNGQIRKNYVFDFMETYFYDYETGKSLFERNKNLVPAEAEEKLAKANKREWKEKELSAEELLKLRKDRLTKSLKKANKEFDEMRWDSEDANNLINGNAVSADEIPDDDETIPF